MIDEKSLRLGSYVMYENTTHVVEELRGRNNTIVTRWIKGEDHYIHTADELDPIPLTEEILLKCGFEQELLDPSNPEEGVYYILYLSDDKYCDLSLISCDKNGFLEVGLFPYEEVFRYKYLHQLQNIIYCLTGTELEVSW